MIAMVGVKDVDLDQVSEGLKKNGIYCKRHGNYLGNYIETYCSGKFALKLFEDGSMQMAMFSDEKESNIDLTEGNTVTLSKIMNIWRKAWHN